MTHAEPNAGEAIAAPGDDEPQASVTVVGPNGVTYVVEALPSGVIGWQYDQAGGYDFGLIVSLAGALWNLVGRVFFGFGWQLKVTRERTRWPHWRKVVARRRFRTKADARTQLPHLTDQIRARGPAAL